MGFPAPASRSAASARRANELAAGPSRTRTYLASFEVVVSPKLEIESTTTALKPLGAVRVEAWMDASNNALHVTRPVEARRDATGGNAVAALFRGGTRHVAHAWIAAWMRAEDGVEAAALTTAARRAGEEATKRHEQSNLRLEALQRRAADSRSRTKTGGGDGNGTPVPTPAPKPLPPRTLIDPATFMVTEPAGTIVFGAPTGERTTKPTDKPLKEPDRKPPRDKTKAPGRAPRAYTDREREDVGMALVKRVLGGDQAEIADIRDQHNVGADAVDDLDDYFELKVHGEAIPDTVRLQDSQVQRALTTDGYFYRAPGQPRRSAGSGIGLTIARGIARGHGGDVTAASPGRGHGSSFTLALPLRA